MPEEEQDATRLVSGVGMGVGVGVGVRVGVEVGVGVIIGVGVGVGVKVGVGVEIGVGGLTPVTPETAPAVAASTRSISAPISLPSVPAFLYREKEVSLKSLPAKLVKPTFWAEDG